MSHLAGAQPQKLTPTVDLDIGVPMVTMKRDMALLAHFEARIKELAASSQVADDDLKSLSRRYTVSSIDWCRSCDADRNDCLNDNGVDTDSEDDDQPTIPNTSLGEQMVSCFKKSQKTMELCQKLREGVITGTLFLPSSKPNDAKQQSTHDKHENRENKCDFNKLALFTVDERPFSVYEHQSGATSLKYYQCDIRDLLTAKTKTLSPSTSATARVPTTPGSVSAHSTNSTPVVVSAPSTSAPKGVVSAPSTPSTTPPSTSSEKKTQTSTDTKTTRPLRSIIASSSQIHLSERLIQLIFGLESNLSMRQLFGVPFELALDHMSYSGPGVIPAHSLRFVDKTDVDLLGSVEIELGFVDYEGGDIFFPSYEHHETITNPRKKAAPPTVLAGTPPKTGALTVTAVVGAQRSVGFTPITKGTRVALVFSVINKHCLSSEERDEIDLGNDEVQTNALLDAVVVDSAKNILMKNWNRYTNELYSCESMVRTLEETEYLNVSRRVKLFPPFRYIYVSVPGLLKPPRTIPKQNIPQSTYVYSSTELELVKSRSVMQSRYHLASHGWYFHNRWSDELKTQGAFSIVFDPSEVLEFLRREPCDKRNNPESLIEWLHALSDVEIVYLPVVVTHHQKIGDADTNDDIQHKIKSYYLLSDELIGIVHHFFRGRSRRSKDMYASGFWDATDVSSDSVGMGIACIIIHRDELKRSQAKRDQYIMDRNRKKTLKLSSVTASCVASVTDAKAAVDADAKSDAKATTTTTKKRKCNCGLDSPTGLTDSTTTIFNATETLAKFDAQSGSLSGTLSVPVVPSPAKRNKVTPSSCVSNPIITDVFTNPTGVSVNSTGISTNPTDSGVSTNSAVFSDIATPTVTIAQFNRRVSERLKFKYQKK